MTIKDFTSEVEDFVRYITGWPGSIRPDTCDLQVIQEIYVEDVYRAKPFMKDARVLDLGANVGVFSIWAKQQGASEVVAFEPVHDNVVQFKKNMEGLEGITICQMAVGGSMGRCRIVANAADIAYISSGGDEVQMWNLDSVVWEYAPFDFCKIDVEGAEWETLDAASTNTISALNHIAIEFHGLGTGGIPQPPGAFGALVSKLARTHCVHTLGRPETGGYIYADRF